MKQICGLILFLLILSPFIGISQENKLSDSTIYWQLITDDGNRFVGKIIKSSEKQIVINANYYGKIVIQKSRIRDIKALEVLEEKNDQLWLPNPQSSRYFWSPSSYGLKTEEGYYQNVWVLFNQVSYGFTDHFTVGLGTVPLFLMGGEATPVWVTPKLSFPVIKNKFNMGAGVIAGTLWGEDESSFGIAYGIGTLGDRNANVTLGAGWAFADNELNKNVIINASGLLRVSDKTYLIAENYFFTADRDVVVLSLIGARTVWSKLSLDYGLVLPLNAFDESFMAIPWLGLVLPF